MKNKYVTKAGTVIKYNFLVKDGVITIGVGIALTVAALLMQRKSYMDGFTDMEDLVIRGK